MKSGPPAPEPARPTPLDALPFALLVSLGALPSALGTEPGKFPLLVAAYALSLVALLFTIVSLRRTRHTWVDPIGSWLFFVIYALIRDATGGPASGVVALISVPIVWLALFGTRFELVVSAGLAFASLTVPHLLDPTTYPDIELQRATLWTGFALLLAPVIQRLVRDLAARTAQERQNATRLRGIMAGATLSSLITTDPRGVITSVNQGAENMLGYTAEELIGRPATSVHDPDELAQVAAELGVDPARALGQLAHSGAPSRIWRYVARDGRRLFVRLAVTPLYDDDGVVVGYLGIAIDATEAQESNQALAAAEQRWRLAMDHLPEMTVLMLDEDLNVSLVAGAGAMRQGVARALGGSLKPFSSPQNVEQLTDGVRRALAGEDAQVILRSTATDAEHQVTFCPMPQVPGRRPEVLTLARDVSAERAHERALTAARDRAELLLSSAPHGVAVVTTEGVVEQVNPAICALLGRSDAELTGSDLDALTAPGTSGLAAHLAEVAARGVGAPAQHTEWAVARAAGEPAYLSVGSAVVPGAEHDQILLTLTDLSERQRHQEELSWLAEHDTLTGLANRRRFENWLTGHLAACRHRGAIGALLMVDLDHFKAVNDTQGHSAGDRLLIAVADTLRTSVRSGDLVARLGGDEFAVLLPDADRLGAEVVAEHIVQQIRVAVARGRGASAGVTASIGIAMVDERQLDTEAFLAAADLTMYDAKAGGRDRWVTVSRDLQGSSRAPERRGWSAQLQQALRDDQLVLHLQPVRHVASGRVRGAEALVLLPDGDRLVGTEEFLPRNEHSILAREVDRWAIDRVVAAQARISRVTPQFTLAYTMLSGFADAQLADTLADSTARHDVDPTTLLLAISTHRTTTDPALWEDTARRVTAMGCRLALDDFGVGFAALSYLRQLPLSGIRIHRSFVTGGLRHATDQTAFASAVTMAHDLGKVLMAEGVDDDATLAAVTAAGADLVQGDCIGAPVPLPEFIATQEARDGRATVSLRSGR